MSAKTPSIPTLTDAQSREHWVESMLRAAPRTREDIEATYDAWMAEHDARVRQAVLQEVPTVNQCVAILNAVSVPLGDPPMKGEWLPAAINRCREALLAARQETRHD